ncbi:hypothetical protein [Shewanella seohaensis]|uniref:Uncharacterized protein n=1 Tax=Shewanella seohaensis TaxID=755175 RepID=A0ABV4VXG0_9GAMM
MKFEDFLKNSALVISLITAFFYCSSMVYTHAYLRRLGLDSDVLERSFHAVVYQGFMFNLSAMMITLMIFTALVWVRTIVIIDFRKFVKTSRRNARRVCTLKNKLLNFFNIKRRSFREDEKILIKKAIIVSQFFLLLLIALFILAKYEQRGGNVANTLKQRIAERLAEKYEHNKTAVATNIQPYSIMTQSVPKSDSDLIFLYCGSRMCAGFDLEKEQVVYIPQASFTMKTEYFGMSSPEF